MHTLWFALLFTSVAAAEDAQAGQAIYTAKCAACHGPAGKGDGPAAAALPRPPQDMTTAAFWSAMTDERLRATITRGKPGTAMRPFPMKDPQLSELVSYLKSLAPSE